MHEQDPQQREERPGVYEAAQKHWEQLADPAGLRAEFASNYLGCWPDKQSFGRELAGDSGLPHDAGGEIAEQLGASQELAYVLDEHGVHVFVHPVGPDTRQRRAGQRLRHLQLVPRVQAEDELEPKPTRPRHG